jgi:deazaflavin-dependent oxidoreductase (nitroreductase family)
MRTAVASVGHSLQLAYLRLHQAVYQRTRGRIGHRLAGSPSLMLRTTGRRSGSPRTAVLTYARDGADFVLVASNDGQDRPPAWFLNVGANPAVGVQVARRRADGRARVVEQRDADYPRLWKLVNDGNHHRYERYQRRTARPIPLVVVTPGGPLVERGHGQHGTRRPAADG